MPGKDNDDIANENEAEATISTGTDVETGTGTWEVAPDTSEGKQDVPEKTEETIDTAKNGKTNAMTAIKRLEKVHSDLAEVLQSKVVKPVNQLSFDFGALKQISEKTHKALEQLENRTALLEKTEKTTSESEQGAEADPKTEGLQESKAGPQESGDPIIEVSTKIDDLYEEFKALIARLEKIEKQFSRLEKAEKIPESPAEVEKSNEAASRVLKKSETEKSEEVNLEDTGKESVLKDQESAQTRELNIEELIAQAKKREKKNLDEDKKIVEINLRHARFWEAQGKKLKSEIQKVENRATDIIDSSKAILETLPPGLKDELQNSQEGLNIVGRMLKRLVDPGDRLNELTKGVVSTGTWKELQENEWEKVLENETTEESALRAINKRLNVTGRENYRIVSSLNEMAEKRQKMCLSFFERQVLPILDGVNDGKKHLIQRIGELKEEYPEKVSGLNDWFKAYTDLQDELTKLLEKMGVYRMVIEPGTKIDFESHEPFGVEPDPEMEDEQIKEIIREGYEYTTQDGNRQVLRAAQVVVVKNKS